MDALEREALEVLSLIRSLKNSSAPINQIPIDVLSLIPNYCREWEVDETLITLTHVCRGWRNLFLSRSSLWTKLHFMDVDKTRTYIQRSKSSRLELYLKDDKWGTNFLRDAFSLVIPHIHKLKSLVVEAEDLPEVLDHFRCNTSFLEKLEIRVHNRRGKALDSRLFSGGLSSLRELTLTNITTRFTQLLDLLESAPLLRKARLSVSFSDSSDTPPTRIIPLRHMKTLDIYTVPHSILLNHLSIPTGASLTLSVNLNDEESPLSYCLPGAPSDIRILSHITTTGLYFSPRCKFAVLSGPSGTLRLIVRCEGQKILPSTVNPQILRSLGPHILPTTQRLTIWAGTGSNPAEIEKSLVCQTLSSAINLQTLILYGCSSLAFILALDPEKNPSKLVLCPNLKELILFTKLWGFSDQLIGMAKSRASRRAVISAITIGGSLPEEEVSRLKENIGQVECRPDYSPPEWDYIPGDDKD